MEELVLVPMQGWLEVMYDAYNEVRSDDNDTAWYSYAKEFLADQKSDLDYDSILEEVKATGGANYGTGVRKE
ncbi:hypothetical protein PTSG_07080 [Salpingoeca rosetta]|uniref:Uncharacterized protein n=1 Tax=Salpingoeca rosetta (strain ATCC 50818 / BSB-021) TaxID=946362 RepID=F2UE00_SALR5|nr:uncharacterized protein PTSG_07080 [Salpingoeca rosetta]EGD74850.1 hypothetical protein PTSG_07080 [Salpingoeca rosetta]|eukprot:XP_004992495.1 hypothetical protein PTSG_07080 [Salpingoeca rosetta]